MADSKVRDRFPEKVMVLRHNKTKKKKKRKGEKKGGGKVRKLGDNLNFKNSLALVCDSCHFGDLMVLPAGDTPLP